MSHPTSPLSPTAFPGDEPVDRSLRPDSFATYIGQETAKESLRIAITAAKARQTTVDHILLYGPPGLGKTSLAYLIAREMGSSLRTTSGAVIGKAGDLAAILTNLQEGEVLFIDEIHRLPRTLEEILYPAMEDSCLDLLIGKGPSARTVRLDLPHFTLVGATTRAGSLSQPLRDRFGLVHRLEYYTEDELAEILRRSANLLGLPITDEARAHIATRSRRTPRVANRLLRRIRDYVTVVGIEEVGIREAAEALDQLHVDQLGLDSTDRLLLSVIQEKFGGGPVGIETLAAATGEEVETLEDVIEPYLLQMGFLDRTPRGRTITDRARRHLGFPLPIG